MRRALLVLMVLVGCGEDEAAEAMKKCDYLQGTFCSKAEACGVLTRADCLTAVKQEIDCSKAIGVEASYTRCIDEIRAATCAVWADPDSKGPASCQHVFKHE